MKVKSWNLKAAKYNVVHVQYVGLGYGWVILRNGVGLINIRTELFAVFIFPSFSDECTCQSMASWEFQQLDTDFDGHLSDTELRPLKPSSDNVEAACVTKFTTACDHDRDGTLSEKEWCCCFADVCESSSCYILNLLLSFLTCPIDVKLYQCSPWQLSFWTVIIITSLFGMHHQCVAPLAANSLHSGLFKASSIASSKVRLCWARSFFRVAIQEV